MKMIALVCLMSASILLTGCGPTAEQELTLRLPASADPATVELVLKKRLKAHAANVIEFKVENSVVGVRYTVPFAMRDPQLKSLLQPGKLGFHVVASNNTDLVSNFWMQVGDLMPDAVLGEHESEKQQMIMADSPPPFPEMSLPPGLQGLFLNDAYYLAEGRKGPPRSYSPCFFEERSRLAPGLVKKVRVDQQNDDFVLQLEFTAEGREAFAALTKRLAPGGAEAPSKGGGRKLAAILDGQILCAPVINESISGGTAMISGNFSRETADRLAWLINAGWLGTDEPLTFLSIRSGDPK